jgi:hypothetical protein
VGGGGGIEDVGDSFFGGAHGAFLSQLCVCVLSVCRYVNTILISTIIVVGKN